MSEYPECIRIKANGEPCGSPALRGQKLCYFHYRWEHPSAAPAPPPKPEIPAAPDRLPAPLDIPFLEDADSIQVALSRVTRAILSGALDYRIATLALWALQTASSNCRHLHPPEVYVTDFDPSNPDLETDPPDDATDAPDEPDDADHSQDRLESSLASLFKLRADG